MVVEKPPLGVGSACVELEASLQTCKKKRIKTKNMNCKINDNKKERLQAGGLRLIRRSETLRRARGVVSYDFTNNNLGYLGKKGNKWYENLGYGLGALANLADFNQLINSTPATLYTDDSDFISHSAIVDDSGNTMMSFGPNDTKVPDTKLGYATYFRKSTSDFHYNPTLPVELSVNKYAIDAVRGLGKILPFQGITTNCVNMSSLSLWLNGIPNLGLHPYLLYATTWAYSTGIRPDLFSYYLTNPYIRK